MRVHVVAVLLVVGVVFSLCLYGFVYAARGVVYASSLFVERRYADSAVRSAGVFMYSGFLAFALAAVYETYARIEGACASYGGVINMVVVLLFPVMVIMVAVGAVESAFHIVSGRGVAGILLAAGMNGVLVLASVMFVVAESMYRWYMCERRRV